MQNATACEQVHTNDSNAAHKYQYAHHIVQIMILWQDEAAPVAVRPAAVFSRGSSHLAIARIVQFTCQWILRFSDWGGWIAMEVLAEPVNPSSGGLPPTLGISQSWIYRDWVIIETWLSFHELNESWSNRLVGFPFMILQRSHLNMHVTCDLWPLGTALILQTTNQDGWTIFEVPLVVLTSPYMVYLALVYVSIPFTVS